MIRKIRLYLDRWNNYKLNLKKRSKIAHALVEWTQVILEALVLALIIKEFIIQVSVVPTGSMIPTMIGGRANQFNDRLIVNKYVYRFGLPKRGDIVVFESPHKDGKDYVKRCIGLPGETVELRNGYVYINGKELVLVGVDIQRDYSYFGPVVVPVKHYLMLGDNRAMSQDSRFWGYVPEEDLIGKAFFTFWPFNRMRVLR